MSFGGIDTDSLAKARGIPAGVAARDASDIIDALQASLKRNSRENVTFGGVPLPRPPAWRTDTFGPDWPLIADPLDPARPDSGQPDPRLDQYPVAWNVQVGRDRHLNWETLKAASETPLFRACIEYRKQELATMDWQIRVNPKVASRIAQQSGKNKDQVAQELRDKHQAEIDRITDFWTMPDRKNGRTFAEWIALAADEQLTHDALAVYPRMTYGGDLLDLWIIDGTTIMPLRDETGGRPEAPAPAYQQVLYGFPRGEYTAQTFERADGSKVVPGGLTAGQLVYRRRYVRAKTPYGYSPTEQALLDGLLWNKRFQWMLAEYTEGTMPAQFMEQDGALDWTPTQLLEYERDFNNRYSGQTAERMRFPLLPPGMHAAAMAQVGERYKPEYDLFLIKLVSMHFNVMASELGFNDSGGLGSSGYHDGQEDIQFRKSRLPDLRWFADFCTSLSCTYLKMNPELEFAFLGLDEEDEAAADELDQNRASSARITLNEARASLGLAAYGFKEANMPYIATQRGVIFLEGASEVAPPGVLIEPASEQNDIDPGTGKTPQGKPGQQAAKKPIKPVSNTAKDAELASYRKWLAKGQHARAFNFEHWSNQELEDLAWLPANTYKASDAGPKANGPAGLSTSTRSPYSDLS